MNIFKRGFIYLVRKPAKTLALFLIVFILGNLTAGAVSIYIRGERGGGKSQESGQHGGDH